MDEKEAQIQEALGVLPVDRYITKLEAIARTIAWDSNIPTINNLIVVMNDYHMPVREFILRAWAPGYVYCSTMPLYKFLETWITDQLVDPLEFFKSAQWAKSSQISGNDLDNLFHHIAAA